MAIIKRHIEKSAEATMNLGEMQFLKIRSLISQDIECEESELAKEDSKLWGELALDLRKGMWKTLKGLGKSTEEDRKLFEACERKVQEAITREKEGKV
jgi:hypothetical protein